MVARWDKELLRFDEFKDMPKFFVVRLALQEMFNVSLFRLEVTIPIRTIVRNLVTTISLGKEWEAVAESDELVRMSLGSKQQLYERLPKEEMLMLQRELGNDPNKIVDISDDVYITAVRCKSAEDVSDFIDELNEQASSAADEIWSYLGTNEFTATMLVNAAWLFEVKAPSPNWERSLEVLDKAAQVALAKGVDHLVAAACRSKAIILKEYVEGRGDAVEVINEGIRKLGYAHPTLQDYLAKIYMLDGRYEDAVNLWKNTPPEDENRQTSLRIFSHREALMCAGHLSDWPAAAEFALQGEKAASRLCHLGEIAAVGYMAEHALAIWKSGEIQKALSAFARVVDALKTLPDPNNDMDSFTLHLKVFHAINGLGRHGGDYGRGLELHMGVFSDPHGQEIKKEKDIPQRSLIPLLQTQIEQVRLKYSLRSLSIEALITYYAKFSACSKAFAKSENQSVPPSFDREMIYTLVFAALVNWMGRGKPFMLPIDRWRDDARLNGLLGSGLEGYFDFIERIIDGEDYYLRTLLNKTDESAERQLTASLVLSHRTSLSPDDRFVANIYLILSGNAYTMWREETENYVADLIANSWMSVAEDQRFLLFTPSVTAPKIISAAVDTSTCGLKKAAKVLLAAQKAVKVRFPSEVTHKLLEIAE